MRLRDSYPICQTFHHAGTVVLHHHVGGFDEGFEHAAAFVEGQVDDDGTLVAVHHGEGAADAVVLGSTPKAHEVAVGGLDLDDIRPLVAENRGRDRAGVDGGQVENADAIQGAGHRVLSCVESESNG